MLRALFYISIANLLWLPSVACCWESDFHYGITRWLAIEAGYTALESDNLAYYDEQLDEGALSAVDSVFHYACIGSDVGMSREVRSHHFPSKAAIPGSPTSRAVVKKSAAVEEEIERHIDKPDKDWRFELETFGALLHALQDSWSHQGIPDIPSIPYLPVSCSSELAWGHPQTRGGWQHHDADYTWRWPQDVGEAAAATYWSLVRLRQSEQGQKPRGPSSVGGLPEKLQRDLVEFQRASTKTEKKKWFLGHGFTEVGFLSGISLPDGEETFPTRVLEPARRERLRGKLPRQRADVPNDVRRFFGGFYRDWESSADFTQIARQYVDAKRFAETLHVEVSDPTEFVAQTLRLWRLADHGAVAMLGHRVPAPGTRYRAYFEKLVGDERALSRYEPWIDAFIPLTADPEEPYLIVPVEGSPSRFISLARFLNSPYDTALVVGERTGAGLKITHVDWAIDH